VGGWITLTDFCFWYDGELARRLTHPRFGVKKLYHVKLSACPTAEEFALLRKGIRLEDGVAAPARARLWRN
jgi:16S rRNA U516 pseudouridylate synthase RsuA-like enzyme